MIKIHFITAVTKRDASSLISKKKTNQQQNKTLTFCHRWENTMEIPGVYLNSPQLM